MMLYMTLNVSPDRFYLTRLIQLDFKEATIKCWDAQIYQPPILFVRYCINITPSEYRLHHEKGRYRRFIN